MKIWHRLQISCYKKKLGINDLKFDHGKNTRLIKLGEKYINIKIFTDKLIQKQGNRQDMQKFSWHGSFLSERPRQARISGIYSFSFG